MSSRIILLAILISALFAPSLSSPHPSSSCYAVDRHNYLYDFTSVTGANFSYTNADGSIFTLRFCEDIRITPGALGADVTSFGHFKKFVGPVDSKYAFIQKYMYGDLGGCASHGIEGLGRNAQVNIICDGCPTGTQCIDASDSSGGCICSAQIDSDSCLVTVLVSIHCAQFQGEKVLEGLTVGLTPRTSEVVRDGVVQWGFEDASHPGYAFETEQRRVALYLSAPFAVSNSIHLPAIELSGESASSLEVVLTGPAMDKRHPALATSLSPSILNVDFRCRKTSASPYAVKFSLPVDVLFEPLTFTLLKHCDYSQGVECGGSAFWAYLGLFGLIGVLVGSIGCMGGFAYNVLQHHQSGFEALPGHARIVQALTRASAGVSRYRRVPTSSSFPPAEPMLGSGRTAPPTSSYGTV